MLPDGKKVRKFDEENFFTITKVVCVIPFH